MSRESCNRLINGIAMGLLGYVAGVILIYTLCGIWEVASRVAMVR